MVGLGAVGSLIVFFLNRAGYTPSAVARSKCDVYYFCLSPGECVELSLEGGVELGDVRYTFLAVKAYDTASTLHLLKGAVLVAQNGVGGYELVKERYGRAYPLVVTYGVYRSGCKTELRGVGEFIAPADVCEAAEALERGGARVRVVDDVEPYRCAKLAVNAAINAITAVLQAPNGVVASVSYLRDLAAAAAREVEKVCAALGVRLPVDPVEEVYRVAEATAANLSSTARDVSMCVPTEVDYINGAVVKLGERLGVATPVNKTLYLLVKAREEICRRGS